MRLHQPAVGGQSPRPDDLDRHAGAPPGIPGGAYGRAIERIARPVASAGRAAFRLGTRPTHGAGSPGPGSMRRAADLAANGFLRAARATLVDGDAVEQHGRAAALALGRLEQMTRAWRADGQHGGARPLSPAAERRSTPPRVGEPAGTSATARLFVAVVPACPGVLSPELALVDPELAASARARLHQPGAFVPGLGSGPRPPTAESPGRRADDAVRPAQRRLQAGWEPATHASVSRADRFFEPLPDEPPSLQRATLTIAAAASAVGIGAGLASLPADSADRPGPSGAVALVAGGATVTPQMSSTNNLGQARTEPPTAAPASSSPEAGSGSKAAGLGRTFVWMSDPDAGGYEVQLFRGPDRVFARRVTEPRVTIGPTWRQDGRIRALEPGAYRWYVWSVGADGERRETPLVQTRVVIDR